MTDYLVEKLSLREQAEIPPEPVNIPSAVVPPKCWEVKEGDGQMPAVQLHDYDEADRNTSLDETNEIRKHWPLIEDRYKDVKHIINLQGTSWLDWQLDVLGLFNFEQKSRRGDGIEDTNEDDIPAMVDNAINPEKPRKQLCAGTGGSKYNVLDMVAQSSSKFAIIETMDFFNFPEKIGDVWFYNETPMTWETHPHLFTSRCNRKLVKAENRTWISRRGVQAVSDGGLAGAKMKEWWPNPSKVPVAQPFSALKFYPSLPVQLHLYKESVIVDGELFPQTGGITIAADAYRFYGSKVYVRDKNTGYWYLAEEMLIRAGLLTGWYARATDYRCYAVLPGESIPWIGDRGYGVPDPGIFRKDLPLFAIMDALVRTNRGWYL